MRLIPNETDLVILQTIVSLHSFRYGKEFRLTSGKVSDVYFDMKPTVLYPQAANIIGALVADKAHKLRCEIIAGLEVGAIPIVALAVAMSTGTDFPIRGLFVRKKSKEHGVGNKVEGLLENEFIGGKNVLIVEDVTTTGQSAAEAAYALRDKDAIVRDVMTIVDRREGAAEFLFRNDLKLHSIFEMSDFVVPE